MLIGMIAIRNVASTCSTGGATSPMAFHAFRRACGFYSWYRLRPTCRAPETSKDNAACARSFRVRQFAWLIEAPRRSSAIGTEVSAERHKSDLRATAAPRPERTKKAFDFVAWKGGVRCSDAVQAMGAWLARCGRVSGQRVARSHATVSVSPIREELGR